MTRTRRVGVVLVAVALVALAGAPPAAAKRVPPCALISPEELEPIFEQPFRGGRLEIGDTCRFEKDPEANVPNVVVHLRAEEYSSQKRAKAAYRRSAEIVRELSAAGATQIDQIGDQAYYAFFVGTDQLTIRVGRIVVEMAVDRPDDEQATFAEEIVAVGTVIAARLRAGPPAAPQTTTTQA